MKYDFFSRFDVNEIRFSEKAKDLLYDAEEIAIKLKNTEVLIEHLFLAIFHMENDAVIEIFSRLKINGDKVEKCVYSELAKLPKLYQGSIKISPALKLMVKISTIISGKRGSSAVDPLELFACIFEDDRNKVSTYIYKTFGVDSRKINELIISYLIEKEVTSERLAKKYELPPFIKHFATNINALVMQGKIPPIYGRDSELEQVISILCHKERSNSAILIGEPGVGKTAIAEALAMRIELENHRVPSRLRDCQIVNLQMNTMVSGTMLRGMFEERVQNVIREIKEKPNLILFIDEVHTMIGAGAALGAPSDAANIFKSVLSRGEVRIIGATTLEEYKKIIEEDEALTRRFTKVYVNEPSIEESRNILYSIRSRHEKNYGVCISDSAIETAIALAPRYQRNLRLPDKVIGWIDSASVRVQMKDRLEVESRDVINVIATVSQIPVDMVSREPAFSLEDIETRLSQRVIGQREAINAVARRIILNKGPLKDNFFSPDGVLLFLGPTGVGKTELAKGLAEFLFGDEKKMIRIDMSEYQDGNSTAKLIGMPRGIVDSARGGILTSQVNDRPYSVVLLDEIEKAPSVHNLFLQVFDEGWIADGRGKRVYLSDTIIIMTSNIGSHHFKRLTNPLGFGDGSSSGDHNRVRSEILKEVDKVFSPEFRNRIHDIVMFSPLTIEEVGLITLKKIRELEERLKVEGKKLRYDPDVLEAIVKEGYSVQYGARHLKRVIEFLVAMPISQKWKESDHFHIKLDNGRVVVDINGIPNGKKALT